MKVSYDITLRDGLYIAQMNRPVLTPLECQKVQQFGEPYIQVGGTFTGTVARPGYTTTTLAFSGGGGTGATAVPILDIEGGIIAVTVTAGGSGYTGVPSVTITGVGSGATLTAVVTGNAVTSVTINTPGSGYQITPAVVGFTLPSVLLRMESDFPTTQVFSVLDTYDADAYATVWCQTVQANFVIARNQLLEQGSPLEGETVVTL